MMRSSRRTSSRGPGRSNAQATISYRKPFDLMTPGEGQRWLEGLRDQLARKQQRERTYLDRRAARGTRTPIDDAYETDQVLEDGLIALLDRLISEIREGRRPQTMNEGLWHHYQGLLGQAPTQAQRHCVSCWYKTSADPFPADWSSSLCPSCAQQTKQRLSLLKRPDGFALVQRLRLLQR